jgi:hypothetical protein
MKPRTRYTREGHALGRRGSSLFLMVVLFGILMLVGLVVGGLIAMTSYAPRMKSQVRTFARIGDSNDVMTLVETQQAAVRAVKEILDTPDSAKFDLEASRIGEKTFTAQGRLIAPDALGVPKTHSVLLSFYQDAKGQPMDLAIFIMDDEAVFIDQTIMEKVSADSRSHGTPTGQDRSANRPPLIQN